MLKNNRTLLLYGALLLMSINVNGQERYPMLINLKGVDEQPWTFGLIFGTSTYSLSYKNQSTIAPKIHESVGKNVRLLAESRIAKNIHLRFEPGVVLNRTSIGNIGSENIDKGFTEFQIPLLLKFQGRRNGNFNPFIIGGVVANYKTNNDLENVDDWEIPYQRLMNSSEIGIGSDFYLKKSKIGVSVRYLSALGTDLKLGIPSEISNLKTHAILFLISFETKDGWKLYGR
ncbi:MAG: outer membrane beta-barrel protein [Bacteroidetes bacterium]|nr:outer membrane beta-barrel protein [Bacteroidota bacterium]